MALDVLWAWCTVPRESYGALHWVSRVRESLGLVWLPLTFRISQTETVARLRRTERAQRPRPGK